MDNDDLYYEKPNLGKFFESAKELQEKESFIDIYLKPLGNKGSKKEFKKFKDKYLKWNDYEIHNVLLTENGFPAHKLVLASSSPFFKEMFLEHYNDHRENFLTVLMPNTSAAALYFILVYIYTGVFNVPSVIYDEVYSLAKNFKILSLLSMIDPMIEISNQEPSMNICQQIEVDNSIKCTVDDKGVEIASKIMSNQPIKNKQSFKKVNFCKRKRQRSINPKYCSGLYENVILRKRKYGKRGSKHRYQSPLMKSPLKSNQISLEESNMPKRIFIKTKKINSKVQSDSLKLGNEISSCVSQPETAKHMSSNSGFMNHVESSGNIKDSDIFANLSDVTGNVNYTTDDTIKQKKSLSQINNEFFKREFIDSSSNDNLIKLKSQVDSKCEFCTFVTDKISDLKNHMENIHNKFNKICLYCGKYFRRWNDLIIHEARHLPPSLECENCGKKFKLAKDLHAHMLAVHAERKKSHTCSICYKKIKSERSLDLHIKEVHQNIRSFKCDICNKSFKRKERLLIHKHKFKCNLCDKSFVHSLNLRLHQHSHETDSKSQSLVPDIAERLGSPIQHEMNRMELRKDELENIESKLTTNVDLHLPTSSKINLTNLANDENLSLENSALCLPSHMLESGMPHTGIECHERLDHKAKEPAPKTLIKVRRIKIPLPTKSDSIIPNRNIFNDGIEHSANTSLQSLNTYINSNVVSSEFNIFDCKTVDSFNSLKIPLDLPLPLSKDGIIDNSELTSDVLTTDLDMSLTNELSSDLKETSVMDLAKFDSSLKVLESTYGNKSPNLVACDPSAAFFISDELGKPVLLGGYTSPHVIMDDWHLGINENEKGHNDDKSFDSLLETTNQFIFDNVDSSKGFTDENNGENVFYTSMPKFSGQEQDKILLDILSSED